MKKKKTEADSQIELQFDSALALRLVEILARAGRAAEALNLSPDQGEGGRNDDSRESIPSITS